MTQSNPLPRDLQNFSELMDAQPANVRELLHYALAMMLVENGKGEIMGTRQADGREWLTVRTSAKEIFEIAKPQASKELLDRLKAQVREIVQDENGE